MLRLVRFNYRAMVLMVFLLLTTIFTFSQFTITFQLNTVPVNHLPDSVFVAGNFNDWAPHLHGNGVEKKNGSFFLQIHNLPAGEHQYKFTRGNWQTVECMSDGKDIGNRRITLSSDTTIPVTINAWKDDFEVVERQHTASPNVRIMDTAFEIPQLGRTRRIWLYLPPGYSKSDKRYPVIYMQDGQNIFDEYTSASGEWKVDECADSLIRMGKPACIIVGIDNGPERIIEYNPFDYDGYGAGEGDQYVDFIVENLKPYIDRHYRTLPSGDNTIIAGSSMGGLISYYAMLKYPAVFGKGGIFSPSFWMAEKIKGLTVTSGKNLKGTLFFYMGGLEGDRHKEDTKEVTEKLGRNSNALIYLVEDPVGRHQEAAWRKWFPEFYKWVLAKGFNNLIELEEN